MEGKGHAELPENKVKSDSTEPQNAANLFEAAYGIRGNAPTPWVRASSLVTIAEKMFDEIDTNHNGFLSKSELAAAVQNKNYTGAQAQVVAAMYQLKGKIENYNNDEWGPEISGISRADLKKFDNAAKQFDQERILSWQSARLAPSFFDKVDKNHDGYLSSAEIDAAIRQNSPPEARPVLEHLRQHFDQYQSASNDEWGPESNGITRKDISAYGTNVLDLTVPNQVEEVTWRTKNGQDAAITKDLYATKDPLESIKPAAIKQGTSNCYFEGVLASVAQANPNTIKEMIQPGSAPGKYRVTFPGAPSEPIEISAPTDAELGLYNGGSQYGRWASVIEKAYGKYCQNHFWRRDPFNPLGGNTPAEGSEGGGTVERAMTLMTGKTTDTDILLLNSESTTRQKLTEAFRSDAPVPVAAGIALSLPNLIGERGKTSDGFATAHCYSITGFDPKGPDGGTVRVRNPWGQLDDTPEGTIEISLRKFMKNFSTIVYGEKSAALF